MKQVRIALYAQKRLAEIWEDADRLRQIIKDTGASPTPEARLELNIMMIKELKNFRWHNAGCLRQIIHDTGARLLPEAQQELSKMLIQALQLNDWENAEFVQRIIQHTGALVRYFVVFRSLLKSFNFLLLFAFQA